MARERADFVIFLGDLFFLNNPSNETLTNTLSILKQQVLGDGEIDFAVRKYDPNFANSSCSLSEEDFNICLPIFSIHGQQDCPSAENLTSSLDILHFSNYVGGDHTDKLRGKDNEF